MAMLSISCKDTLSAGSRIFAGICNWCDIKDEDKTITCCKLEKGNVEYGILKETGEDDTVEINIEGNIKKISRQSAKELNLI